MYIYCLWVAGSFKGKGIGKELLEYAINDAKQRRMNGICIFSNWANFNKGEFVSNTILNANS